MGIDGIQRNDWGDGGEASASRSVVPATASNTPAVRTVDDLPIGVPFPGTELLRLSQQQGVNATAAAGIAPEVAREMRNSADGLEANLQRAAENAGRLEQGFAKALGCTVEALNAELAKAPPAMRAKFQREVWKGTRNLDIRLQRAFTLQEQHLYSEAIGRLLDSAGR